MKERYFVPGSIAGEWYRQTGRQSGLPFGYFEGPSERLGDRLIVVFAVIVLLLLLGWPL